MKSFIYFLFLFSFLQINAQQTIVTYGRTTIEIKISRPQSGTLYYVLYKTKPSIFPTAQTIKSDALANLITSAEKKGSVKINSLETNILLKRHISGIPGTINDTDKMYYLYLVFENDISSFENVINHDIILKRKQIAQSFKCTKYPNSDTNQLYYPPFNINCLVYFPESYFHDMSDKKYPLLLSFHGDGEKGTNELNKLRTSFLPNKLEAADFNVEFIVVAPQTNGYKPGWQTPIFLNELIDSLKTNFKVDDKKMYVTGYSGGGGGLCIFSNTYGDLLSAVSPMSGVNAFPSLGSTSYCKLKDVPLWAYHCLNDNTVSSNSTVNLLSGINKCSPTVKPKATYFANGGHNSFTQAFQTDSIFRFFLSKSKQNISGTPMELNFSSTYTTVVNSTGISEITISDFPSTNGLVYKWIKTSGEDLTLVDENSHNLKIKDAKSGTYTFRVLITDANNVTSYKDMSIVLSTITSLEDSQIINHKNKSDKWQIFSPEGKLLRESEHNPIQFENLGKGFFIIYQGGKTTKVMIE
jgi:hypothetical protein